MTIRKKWILALGLIAIISIAVNSLVLSVLTNRYFTSYLDKNYNKTCQQIQSYLSEQLKTDNYTWQQIGVGLEPYLSDPITAIKVYDNTGSLIVEVRNNPHGGKDGRAMHGMNNPMNSRFHEVDRFPIKADNTSFGEVQIVRYSALENSYAAQMFQSSLFRNSLFSIGIVMILVFFIGLFMSKRISKDLVSTVEMAQNIDIGKENTITFSKTKEIRMIQQNLQSLESRLKLKQKARKTLIDEMVHQTRTPLTILKMHLEGIEDGVIDIEPEEIKVCENQIDNLSAIITNISSMIDAEKNENAVVMEEFELYPFMKQIVNGLKAQFQKKNITFKLLATDKLMITTDKYRLGQSVYNILTNAYKFTPPHGFVHLDYRVEEADLVIEIEDSGCGISEEDQEKIFDAYYKKDKETGKAGDGLGLFIAKENMESVHGSIEVSSAPGKGSKFRLLLPKESLQPLETKL